MKIEKGTNLIISDRRKGTYRGTAKRDFDTKDEWYPMIAQEHVSGMSTDWYPGDEIPCRSCFCKIEVEK